MAPSKRLAIGDALLSAGAMVILVFALWATDDRVRERAAMLADSGPPMAGVADVGGRVSGFGSTAVHVARDWSAAHVYLTIFAAAGVVLFAAVRRL